MPSINDYATLAEAEAMLPDMATADWTTAYQNLLTTLVTRASRLADRQTGRQPGAYFTNVDSTQYFDGPTSTYPRWQGYVNDNRITAGRHPYRSLWIDELADVPTQVWVTPDGNLNNYQLWASTDYIPWPYNAITNGRPYLRLDLDVIYGKNATWYGFPKGIKIIGPFGYSKTVPDDIKQAVLIQIMRWFKRAQQKYQDIAVITDPTQRIYQVPDPDFFKMIEHLRKPAI